MEGLALKYFILKPHGNNSYAKASQEAMKTYAKTIESCNQKLANDIWDWVHREERKHDWEDYDKLVLDIVNLECEMIQARNDLNNMEINLIEMKFAERKLGKNRETKKM